MASHRKVWRLLGRSLTGEAVARIIINEAERQLRDEPPLWSDAEIERLKLPLTRDTKAKHAYVRTINAWCREHGIEMALEEIAPPDEIELSIITRWFLIDNAQTHMPISTPEEAYQAFVEWQPTHGGYLMPLDVFRKHFLEERRALKGHLKGCHPVYGPSGQIIAPALVDP